MKNIVACLCFLIGAAKLIDKVIYWKNNKTLGLLNPIAFQDSYAARFPQKLQFLFTTTPEIATLIVILLFLISAILLWKEENKLFKGLALFSLFLAFWNAFALI